MSIRIRKSTKNNKSNKSPERMTNGPTWAWTLTTYTSSPSTMSSSWSQDNSIDSYNPNSWASNGENVDYFPIMGRRRKRAEAPLDNSQDELISLKTVLDIGLCDNEPKLKIEATTMSKSTTTTTTKKASSSAESFNNLFYPFIILSFLAS